MRLNLFYRNSNKVFERFREPVYKTKYLDLSLQANDEKFSKPVSGLLPEIYSQTNHKLRSTPFSSVTRQNRAAVGVNWGNIYNNPDELRVLPGHFDSEEYALPDLVVYGISNGTRNPASAFSSLSVALTASPQDLGPCSFWKEHNATRNAVPFRNPGHARKTARFSKPQPVDRERPMQGLTQCLTYFLRYELPAYYFC